MKSNLSHKSDAIIIDRDIKMKIKLTPSVFKCEDGKRLIVNQKLEDIVMITENTDKCSFSTRQNVTKRHLTPLSDN